MAYDFDIDKAAQALDKDKEQTLVRPVKGASEVLKPSVDDRDENLEHQSGTSTSTNTSTGNNTSNGGSAAAKKARLSKRSAGFDYSGLGTLVQWQTSGSGKSRYVLAPTKNASDNSVRYVISRLSVPKPLITATTEKWQKQANLSVDEIKSLTMTDVVNLLLLREIEDVEQRNILLALYDTKGVMSKILAAQVPTAGTLTDRQLLEGLADKAQKQEQLLQDVKKQQLTHFSMLQRTLYGVQRAVAWLLIDKLGLIRTKYPDTSKALLGSLNEDNVLSTNDVLDLAGQAQMQRMAQKQATAVRQHK